MGIRFQQESQRRSSSTPTDQQSIDHILGHGILDVIRQPAPVLIPRRSIFVDPFQVAVEYLERGGMGRRGGGGVRMI